MLLRLAAIAFDFTQVTAIHRGELLPRFLDFLHPVRGVKASFDSLSQRHLLLSVQQSDLTDLLQISTDGVSRCRELGILPSLAKRGGFIFIPDEAAVVVVLFGLLLFAVFFLVVFIFLVITVEVVVEVFLQVIFEVLIFQILFEVWFKVVLVHFIGMVELIWQRGIGDRYGVLCRQLILVNLGRRLLRGALCRGLLSGGLFRSCFLGRGLPSRFLHSLLSDLLHGLFRNLLGGLLCRLCGFLTSFRWGRHCTRCCRR